MELKQRSWCFLDRIIFFKPNQNLSIDIHKTFGFNRPGQHPPQIKILKLAHPLYNGWKQDFKDRQLPILGWTKNPCISIPKELEGLVKEVNPEARRRGTYFDFALVYPDLRQGPRCQTRDVGTTIASQRVSI